MPINKAVDQANGAPKFTGLDVTANSEVLYGNTTANVARAGMTTTILAVDATEIGIAGDKVLRIKIVDGGTGYTNGEIIRVNGATTNANVVITTNSTGGITSVTIGNTGVGVVPTSNLAIVNSTFGATVTGSGANLVFMLGEGKKIPHTGWVLRKEGTGQRAGRVQYEVLVAGGITSGDGSDDSQLPDA
jgi:hypothetical protein